MINLLNWAKLLATGIGNYMIALDESIAADASLLDFETLYDFDFDDHLYQESASKEQFPHYHDRADRALRFSKWVRLDIYLKFYCATPYFLSETGLEGGDE